MIICMCTIRYIIINLTIHITIGITIIIAQGKTVPYSSSKQRSNANLKGRDQGSCESEVAKTFSKNPRAGGEQIRLEMKTSFGEHGQCVKVIHWGDPRRLKNHRQQNCEIKNSEVINRDQNEDLDLQPLNEVYAPTIGAQNNMRRPSVEPDGIEVPAIQVEAEARQQPQAQPNGRRGQYDDCKLLHGFHSSCLCVAENVSSLASSQTIAGTCISLLSDIC